MKFYPWGVPIAFLAYSLGFIAGRTTAPVLPMPIPVIVPFETPCWTCVPEVVEVARPCDVEHAANKYPDCAVLYGLEPCSGGELSHCAGWGQPTSEGAP